MTLHLKHSNEDAPLEGGPITTLRTQLEHRAAEFAMVLPSHISPEKLQRTVLTAVQSNPDLLACDRRSFLTACMKAAQDGLLPDGREAAIVPFNTRQKIDGQWGWTKLAQYMPMVFGLRKKILQSDEVTDIYAAVVYRQEIEDGRFIYEEGTERQLRHKPILDADFHPKDEDIALAYSVASYANGGKSFEIMRRWEINEVRESSQSGAQFDAKGEPRESKGPWVEWFAEMAKKTVLRRHSKSLPQSSDIIADVEAEDMAFASRSAMAMLEKAQPDAPRQIEPPVSDEPFDEETGELEDKPEPKAEDKPKRTRKPAAARPEPERVAELEKQAAKGDAAATRADPYPHIPEPEADEPPAEDEPEPSTQIESADEPETDELGVTMTPDQTKADAYVTRAKKCETIIDLRKLEREAEMDLAEMPVHLASIVDTEFDHARKRLQPRRPPDEE